MKKSDFGKRVFLEHVCTKQKFNDKTMHISRDQNKNDPRVKKKPKQYASKGLVMFVWANASRPSSASRPPPQDFRFRDVLSTTTEHFFVLKITSSKQAEFGPRRSACALIIWHQKQAYFSNTYPKYALSTSQKRVILEHVCKKRVLDTLNTRSSRTRMQNSPSQ